MILKICGFFLSEHSTTNDLALTITVHLPALNEDINDSSVIPQETDHNDLPFDEEVKEKKEDQESDQSMNI
jgi:hypothetical protein